VTDAAWQSGECGHFSSGSTSDYFRLPDWRGVFPRFAGANGVLKTANGSGLYDGGTLMQIMKDMMFRHRHYADIATAPGVLNVGFFSNANGAGNEPSGRVTSYPISDGTNGTPNAGKETAPVSVSINIGIYYKN